MISGGADKAARVFDMTTGQPSQVAQHDAPIKSIKWIDANGQGLLATGSWDKTIKYWDLRSQNAVASVTLPERCYSQFEFRFQCSVDSPVTTKLTESGSYGCGLSSASRWYC